jgi:hypothetical protein
MNYSATQASQRRDLWKPLCASSDVANRFVEPPVRRCAQQRSEHRLQSPDQEVGFTIALKKCGDLLIFDLISVACDSFIFSSS